jgi:hypothetical protein
MFMLLSGVILNEGRKERKHKMNTGKEPIQLRIAKCKATVLVGKLEIIIFEEA